MKEQAIQTKIINYLKGEGWLTMKTIVVSPSGYPDIFAFKDGRTIAIEVKTLTNKATQLQLIQLARLNDAGIKAFIARSIEDVRTNTQSL